MTDNNMTQALTSYQFTIDGTVAAWLAQKETIGSKRTWAKYEETMRWFRALLAQGGLGLLSNPIDIAPIGARWVSTLSSHIGVLKMSPSKHICMLERIFGISAGHENERE